MEARSFLSFRDTPATPSPVLLPRLMQSEWRMTCNRSFPSSHRQPEVLTNCDDTGRHIEPVPVCISLVPISQRSFGQKRRLPAKIAYLHEVIAQSNTIVVRRVNRPVDTEYRLPSNQSSICTVRLSVKQSFGSPLFPPPWTCSDDFQTSFFFALSVDDGASIKSH
jgi:hypothetical protein